MVLEAITNLARFAAIRLLTLALIGTMAMDIECVQVLFLLHVVGMHIIALAPVLNPLTAHHGIIYSATRENLDDTTVIIHPLMVVGRMAEGFLVEEGMIGLHEGLGHLELMVCLEIILMSVQEKEIGSARIPHVKT